MKQIDVGVCRTFVGKDSLLTMSSKASSGTLVLVSPSTEMLSRSLASWICSSDIFRARSDGCQSGNTAVGADGLFDVVPLVLAEGSNFFAPSDRAASLLPKLLP